MSTHNIYFYAELAKIVLELLSNTRFICSTDSTTVYWKFPDVKGRLGARPFNSRFKRFVHDGGGKRKRIEWLNFHVGQIKDKFVSDIFKHSKLINDVVQGCGREREIGRGEKGEGELIKREGDGETGRGREKG